MTLAIPIATISFGLNRATLSKLTTLICFLRKQGRSDAALLDAMRARERCWIFP
jgi:hypothetical protein